MDEIEKCVKEMLEFGEEDAGIGVTQKGTVLRFSRANMSDWEEIKDIDNEELIKRFGGLEYLVNEAGFSIRDLQLLDLCSLEIKRRGLEDKVSKGENRKMIETESIRNCIVEVESAENLEELKEAILSGFKAIDKEIFWLEHK